MTDLRELPKLPGVNPGKMAETYLEAKERINTLLARLTPFQAFIILLYLSGFSHAEIAAKVSESGEFITRQGVQYHFTQALKRMGVYHQTREE